MKPQKIIYLDQEKIYDSISNWVKMNLCPYVSEAYLWGSVVKREFGKYTENYQTHEGSDIDVIVFMDITKIPLSWKYLNTEKAWFKLYYGGTIILNRCKHKMEILIVKKDSEIAARDKLNKIFREVERII